MREADGGHDKGGGPAPRLHAGHIGAYVLVVLLFANLNALVDLLFHPEIPYFDQEHLIVGGASALACAVFFGLLGYYAHRLRVSLGRIVTLEALLPICAHCKKIRLADADGKSRNDWQPVESYFERHTRMRLSHGICPSCVKEHFPEADGDVKEHEPGTA